MDLPATLFCIPVTDAEQHGWLALQVLGVIALAVFGAIGAWLGECCPCCPHSWFSGGTFDKTRSVIVHLHGWCSYAPKELNFLFLEDW